MHNVVLRYLVPVIAMAFVGPAAAAPSIKSWVSGTYVYADLCTEGGERIGRRITLRRSPNGDVLTYEGASADWVRVDSVAFADETRSVSFTMETAHGRVAFHGRMETEALTGLIEEEGGTHEVRLPRVLRYHAEAPCRGDIAASVPASH